MYKIDDKEFLNRNDYERYINFIKTKERFIKKYKRKPNRIEELKIMDLVNKGKKIREILKEVIGDVNEFKRSEGI